MTRCFEYWEEQEKSKNVLVLKQQLVCDLLCVVTGYQISIAGKCQKHVISIHLLSFYLTIWSLMLF